MIAKGLFVHVGILAVAAGLAYRSWTADGTTAPKTGETELWAGSPDQVREIRYESKAGSLALQPHEDKAGKYFVGTTVKNPQPTPPAPAPSASQSIDGKDKAPEKPAEPKTASFIATKDGEELVKMVAPLRALRVLGKVTDAQKTDFGFDKEEGKLSVKYGDQERMLVFGGTTPGGADYYAKDVATGNAYVVAGNIVRDLTNADQRLVEHKLHAWDEGAAKRMKITAGTATRELVRNPDKKDAWTKPDAPTEKDETASNWLTKIDRLRTTSYEGDALHPPPAPADYVFKIEYFDERKPIGFVELVRHPAEDGKVDYVARTEQTRWYATVLRSQGEQIDQDLKSVVGQ
jgi:hypothetical protein